MLSVIRRHTQCMQAVIKHIMHTRTNQCNACSVELTEEHIITIMPQKNARALNKTAFFRNW